MVEALNTPDVAPRLDSQVQLDTVEVYPYIEYAKYLLAGSTALGLFVVAMIGGGITFIDDKARGLHEGYLVTPIHKSELVFGLVGSGALKGLMSGLCLTIIGGLIVGIPRLWDPVRLLLSSRGFVRRLDLHDQFHVFSDGARFGPARAARSFRRLEHAAILSLRRCISHRGVPLVAALDFGD